MKDIWKRWQFWVAVAVVILAIVGTVLYFTVPAFKSMVLEIAAGVLIFLVGAIAGFFIK